MIQESIYFNEIKQEQKKQQIFEGLYITSVTV